MQTPANDNCSMQRMLTDWQIRGDIQAAGKQSLLWYERLDLCDPWRLLTWQAENAPKIVPSMEEIERFGLRQTAEEKARIEQITQQLIGRGKA